jgi:hypothetical protein
MTALDAPSTEQVHGSQYRTLQLEHSTRPGEHILDQINSFSPLICLESLVYKPESTSSEVESFSYSIAKEAKLTRSFAGIGNVCGLRSGGLASH